MTFALSEILSKIDGTDMCIGFHNILDDYIDDIKKECKVLELNNSQFIKYRYKPWLLSYDIYGTSDLEFILLKVNNMISAKEFNRHKINILMPDALELINKIYNAEKKYINLNRNSL